MISQKQWKIAKTREYKKKRSKSSVLFKVEMVSVKYVEAAQVQSGVGLKKSGRFSNVFKWGKILWKKLNILKCIKAKKSQKS